MPTRWRICPAFTRWVSTSGEFKPEPTCGGSASRRPDEWQLGQLYNSFVASLEQEVARANHPRLTVVSSAGPGHVGWTAPALGGSVFGYYLQLGLGGAADANGNRQITLAELQAYL